MKGARTFFSGDHNRTDLSVPTEASLRPSELHATWATGWEGAGFTSRGWNAEKVGTYMTVEFYRAPSSLGPATLTTTLRAAGVVCGGGDGGRILVSTTCSGSSGLPFPGFAAGRTEAMMVESKRAHDPSRNRNMYMSITDYC
jgi:hypothetical protein